MQEKVWPISRGAGVTIALLDGGVEAQLPDLKGRVLPGGDLVSGGTDGLKDLSPVEHGTKIAGLMVGQGQGIGMVGVAPDARLLSIRTLEAGGTYGNGSPDSMARAIRHAVDHGAKVINMSMGAPPRADPQCDSELRSAVNYAMEREVIIVAAVGNDGDGHNAVVQPAACPGVLVVASVDRNQKPESFSQRQNYVGVAAPGSALGSVTPDSAEPRGYFQKNLRGTSYSAALVSGVVALLRAKGLSAPESLQRITYTAQDVGPRGHDRETGYGVIRPHEALTASIPANTPNSLYTNWERA